MTIVFSPMFFNFYFIYFFQKIKRLFMELHKLFCKLKMPFTRSYFVSQTCTNFSNFMNYILTFLHKCFCCSNFSELNVFVTLELLLFQIIIYVKLKSSFFSKPRTIFIFFKQSVFHLKMFVIFDKLYL